MRGKTRLSLDEACYGYAALLRLCHKIAFIVGCMAAIEEKLQRMNNINCEFH
jgi:hypothetical protein